MESYRGMIVECKCEPVFTWGRRVQNWKEWRTTHWRFGGGSGVRASLKQGRQEQCACWIELRLSKSQSLQGGIAEANSVWTSTAATCGTDTPRRSLAGVTVISSQVPFGTSYAASIFQVHRQRMKRLARLVRISSKQPSPELSQQNVVQDCFPLDVSLTQIPVNVDLEPKRKRNYKRKPKEVQTCNDHDASKCPPNVTSIVLPPKQTRKQKENVVPEIQRSNVEGASEVGAVVLVKKVRKPRAKKSQEPKVQGALEHDADPLATPKRPRKSRSEKACVEGGCVPLTDSYDLPDTPAPDSFGPPQPDTTPRLQGCARSRRFGKEEKLKGLPMTRRKPRNWVPLLTVSNNTAGVVTRAKRTVS